MPIRTEKRLTITEAHPFHHYISDERDRGGNAVVEPSFDPNCPLCRKDRDMSKPLTEMSDDELQSYFEKNARYRSDAPERQGVQYVIRLGSRHLYSDDTHELREKFFEAVRGR